MVFGVATLTGIRQRQWGISVSAINNRVHADHSTAPTAAAEILDGKTPFTAAGTDVCWAWRDGGLAVTAGTRNTKQRPRVVLAVDDRDTHIEELGGKAWKEWLQLSNWPSLNDPECVTVRSKLSSAPLATVESHASLPPQWQALMDDAVSDDERELIRELAKTVVAVPILGYETDGGEVIDFAWPDVHVGAVWKLIEAFRRQSQMDATLSFPENIAVLIRSQDERDRFVRGLGERGVQARALDKSAAIAGQPVVLTMHCAKGMEFSRVILVGADDKHVPSPATLRSVPEEDRNEAMLRERSLLYVAASRARDALVVTWSGKRTALLGE